METTAAAAWGEEASDGGASATGDRTLTFLFTDIEGSTGHWQRTPQAMRAALQAHDRLLRDTFTRAGGHVFKTIGDAFCVAFPNAPAAVQAALDGQRAVSSHFGPDVSLPLRVRMALHTGDAQERDGDYMGLALSYVARALGLVYGGQVALTEPTAALAGQALPPSTALKDLGTFALRGLDGPCRLFQLLHPDLRGDFPPPRSAYDTPHNLPRALTPFIGREREVTEVTRLLGASPLVTLTGAGGSGKTRLAVEVGETLLGEFPDGVFFADLAPVTDGARVGESVAGALGLRPEPGQDVLAQTTAHLSGKRVLLLLDNCEHLVDACAVLSEQLLQAVPTLRVLATSRESLGIAGETLWPVGGLAFPDGRQTPGPRRLLQYEAARLFADRARAVAPGFALTRENAPHVAAICRRLDGIPLALALAAAWAGVLTPEQIATRLQDRLRFLRTATNRTASARQQTLRATLDWSYNLLTPSEQALLRRLSVFVGGWTLEAAEAVCAQPPVEDVLTDLYALVRKSLVVAQEMPDKSRYSLLETVREYAAQLLAATGEDAEVVRDREQWALEVAERMASRLTAPNAKDALDALDAENGNLRAVYADLNDSTVGIRLIAALFWFWHVRGYVADGIGWAEKFLTDELPSELSPAIAAKAHNGAGILYWDAGRLDAARAHFQRALQLYESCGDQKAAAGSLSNLGSLCGLQGYRDEANEFFERSLLWYREAGDKVRAASVLSNLGSNAKVRGDFETATAHFEEALRIHRENGNRTSEGVAISNLTGIAVRQQDWGRARAYLTANFDLRIGEGNRPGIANCLDDLALVTAGEGDDALSARLLSYAERYRAALGVARSSDEAVALDALRTRLQKRLGQSLYTSEEAAGRMMNLDAALDAASIVTPRGSSKGEV